MTILPQPIQSITILDAVEGEFVSLLTFELGAHFTNLFKEQIFIEALCAACEYNWVLILVGCPLYALLEFLLTIFAYQINLIPNFDILFF